MHCHILSCMQSAKGNSPQVVIRFPPEIYAWLRRSAAKRRVTVSHLVRECVLPSFEARHAKSPAPAAGEQGAA